MGSAPDAKVHRQIVAAGTGIFRRIDAGNAIQDFAHSGGAGFGEIVAADNIAGAGVFKTSFSRASPSQSPITVSVDSVLTGAGSSVRA